MKREDAKKNLELIKAFADGTDIQFWDTGLCMWINIYEPNFQSINNYRTKPKKVTPQENEEVIIANMACWLCDDPSFRAVLKDRGFNYTEMDVFFDKFRVKRLTRSDPTV